MLLDKVGLGHVGTETKLGQLFNQYSSFSDNKL